MKRGIRTERAGTAWMLLGRSWPLSESAPLLCSGGTPLSLFRIPRSRCPTIIGHSVSTPCYPTGQPTTAGIVDAAGVRPGDLRASAIHNDNEGVVSGYLAARWLTRLRNTNLPRGTLFDLVFATNYGIDVIKPSSAETTSWLAIWNEDIARGGAGAIHPCLSLVVIRLACRRNCTNRADAFS